MCAGQPSNGEFFPRSSHCPSAKASCRVLIFRLFGRISIIRLDVYSGKIPTHPPGPPQRHWRRDPHHACRLRTARTFSPACLAWAVEQRAAELIEGHPAIDQRIVLPRGWLRSPVRVWKLRNQLKNLAFDTAIDAQGLTKSAVVAWLSGAKRRIGMGGRWGREISRWLNNELVVTDGLHAIERGLKLLEPLGIQSPAVRFDVPAAAAEPNAVAEMIHRLGLDDGFVLVASGPVGRRSSGPSIAMPPWPPTWDAAGTCRPADLGKRRRTRAGGTNHRGRRGPCSAVSEDHAFAVGRGRPPGLFCDRLRHRAAAPGRGRRHALHRPLRSLAGRQAWSLWSAAHQPARDVYGRHNAPAAACTADPIWKPSMSGWYSRRAIG